MASAEQTEGRRSSEESFAEAREAALERARSRPAAQELVSGAFGDDAEAIFIEREALKARRHSRGALHVVGVAAVSQEEYNLHMRGEPWTPEMIERVRSAPAERVTWLDLWGLGRCEPYAARARFKAMMEQAREEAQNGYWAQTSVSVAGITTPMDAARSMVLREELVQSWQPQNGVERMLVDQLVMLEAVFEQTVAEFLWVNSRMAEEVEYDIELRYDHERARENARCSASGDKDRDKWIPPRIKVADAIDRAAARMDQLHRMVLRTQRALRDMRRYAPVIVQNLGGQVNVGAQQVNVVAPAD